MDWASPAFSLRIEYSIQENVDVGAQGRGQCLGVFAPKADADEFHVQRGEDSSRRPREVDAVPDPAQLREPREDVADRVLELDAINPQLGARMARVIALSGRVTVRATP